MYGLKRALSHQSNPPLHHHHQDQSHPLANKRALQVGARDISLHCYGPRVFNLPPPFGPRHSSTHPGNSMTGADVLPASLRARSGHAASERSPARHQHFCSSSSSSMLGGNKTNVTQLPVKFTRRDKGRNAADGSLFQMNPPSPLCTPFSSLA